jgi:hypothetical protein
VGLLIEETRGASHAKQGRAFATKLRSLFRVCWFEVLGGRRGNEHARLLPVVILPDAMAHLCFFIFCQTGESDRH